MTSAITTRPAGASGAIAALVVVIANKVLHVDLTAEDAAIIVGGIVGIVSTIFPKQSTTVQTAIQEFNGS